MLASCFLMIKYMKNQNTQHFGELCQKQDVLDLLQVLFFLDTRGLIITTAKHIHISKDVHFCIAHNVTNLCLTK